jgi:hypothetical protein
MSEIDSRTPDCRGLGGTVAQSNIEAFASNEANITEIGGEEPGIRFIFER